MQDTIDLQTYAGEDGMIFGCALDGAGGARLVGWREAEGWRSGDGPVWLHLDRTEERVRHWLREESGLTPITVDALLSDDTRPRTFRGKRGTIAILRGVNTNPGADPEDLVGIRMWCDGQRLITLRHHRLQTPRDILVQLIEDGDGPRTVAETFERLITRLTLRMGTVLDEFEDMLDGIEEEIATLDSANALQHLGSLRRDTVALRRYMAPQREAVATLYEEPPEWMDEQSRLRLRETADRPTLYVEALDAARERSAVLRDDINNRMTERMNRNMYVLSIIAAIFLPLGFITGLLGINVGGMPGVESSTAFWVTCGIIVLLFVIEMAIFRALKWI